MKRIITYVTLSILLLTTIRTAAQDNPADTVSKQIYISDLHNVLRTYQPNDYMLKLDLLNPIRFSFFGAKLDLNVSFEHRIGKNSSLQAGVDWSRFIGPGPNRENIGNEPIPQPLIGRDARMELNRSRNVIKTSLEYRFYPEIKKRKKYGMDNTNLSGHYIGLEGQMIWMPLRFSTINHEVLPSFTFKLGRQMRLLNHGFADLSVGLGIRQFLVHQNLEEINGEMLHTPRKPWLLFLQPQARVGMALSRRNPANYNKCAFFDCGKERNRMLKINLLPFFNNFINTAHRDIGLGVEFEQKIGKLPISIIGGIESQLLMTRYSNVEFESFLYPAGNQDSNMLHLTGNFELRYYYNYQRRLLKGRTNSVFSSNFFGVDYSRRGISSYVIGSSHPNSWLKGNNTVSLHWGLQRTFLDFGFIQFKTGFNVYDRLYNSFSEAISLKHNIIDRFHTQLKLGFAF